MKFNSETHIFQFNGTDAYFSQKQALNFNTTNGFVVEGWIHRQNNPNKSIVFQSVPAQGDAVTIALTENNQLSFSIDKYKVETNLDGSQDQWFHFACYYDNAKNKLGIYLNGESSNAIEVDTKRQNYNLSIHNIGADSNGQSLFAGVIGLMRIWTVLPVAGNYEALMHERFNSSSQGLFAEYKFHSENSNNTLPNSGNGGDPTTSRALPINAFGTENWTKFTSLPFQNTLPASVLQITSKEPYYKLGDAKIDIDQSFSIEFWWKFEKISDCNVIQLGRTESNATMSLKFVGVSELQLVANFADVELKSLRSPLDFRWHHWAFVFNAKKRVLHLYKDGELVGRKPCLEAKLNVDPAFYLNVNNANRTFQSEISELRIWTKALDNDEVKKSIFERAKASHHELAYYFPFTKPGINNRHGKGRFVENAEKTTFIIPAEGPTSFEHFQSCCKFDGTSSFLTGDKTTYIQGNEFSFCFWLKRNQIDKQASVISFNQNEFGFTHDNKPYFKVGQTNIVDRASKNMGWQFWAIVVDKQNNNTQIYCDARLLGAFNTGQFFDTSSLSITVGKSINNDQFFNGCITELSIWNKALDIHETMALTYKRLTGLESCLVDYWCLDYDKDGEYKSINGLISLQLHEGATTIPAVHEGHRYSGEKKKVLNALRAKATALVHDAHVNAHNLKSDAHKQATQVLQKAHASAQKLAKKSGKSMYLIGNPDSRTNYPNGWATLGFDFYNSKPRITRPYLMKLTSNGAVESKTDLPAEIVDANPEIGYEKLYWVKPAHEIDVPKFPFIPPAISPYLEINRGQFTITMLVHFQKVVSKQKMGLISIGNSKKGEGFYVYINSEGKICLSDFENEYNDTYQPNLDIRNTENWFKNPNWNQLVFSYDGTNFYVWLNGYLLSIFRLKAPLLNSPITTNVCIGASLYSFQSFASGWSENGGFREYSDVDANAFKGAIAQVKIYNKFFDIYIDKSITTWYFSPNPESEKSLLAHWQFAVDKDKQGFVKYTKKSDNGQNVWDCLSFPIKGFQTSFFTDTSLTSEANFPLRFNGSTSAINLGSKQLSVDGGSVIEFMVNLYDMNNKENCIWFHGAMGQWDFSYIGFTPQNEFLFRYDANYSGGIIKIPLNPDNHVGIWHHWACVVSKDLGVIAVYLDGKELARKSYIHRDSYDCSVLIGNKDFNSDGGLNGLLSNFKISKKSVANALLNGERLASTMYHIDRPDTTQFKLIQDTQSGNKAIDVFGSYGELLNVVWISNDNPVLNKALIEKERPIVKLSPENNFPLKFNGTDSAITLAPLSIAEDGGAVIEFWVNLTAMGSEKCIWFHGAMGQWDFSYIGFTAQNEFLFRYDANYSGGQITIPLNHDDHLDKWHHWACVVSQDKASIAVFLDGKELRRRSYVHRSPYLASAIIGNKNTQSQQGLIGQLTQFKISRKAVANALLDGNTTTWASYDIDTPTTTQLKLVHNFDSGNVIYDSFGNQHQMANVKWNHNENILGGVTLNECDFDGNNLNQTFIAKYGPSDLQSYQYIAGESICKHLSDFKIFFSFVGGSLMVMDLETKTYAELYGLQNLKINSITQEISENAYQIVITGKQPFIIRKSPVSTINKTVYVSVNNINNVAGMNSYDLVANLDLNNQLPFQCVFLSRKNAFFFSQGNTIYVYDIGSNRIVDKIVLDENIFVLSTYDDDDALAARTKNLTDAQDKLKDAQATNDQNAIKLATDDYNKANKSLADLNKEARNDLYVITQSGNYKMYDVDSKTWMNNGKIPESTLRLAEIQQIQLVDSELLLEEALQAKLIEKHNAQILAQQRLIEAHANAALKYAPYKTQLDAETTKANAQIAEKQAEADKRKSDAQAYKAVQQQVHDDGIKQANAEAEVTKSKARAEADQIKADASKDADATQVGASNLTIQAMQVQMKIMNQNE